MIQKKHKPAQHKPATRAKQTHIVLRLYLVAVSCLIAFSVAFALFAALYSIVS